MKIYTSITALVGALVLGSSFGLAQSKAPATPETKSDSAAPQASTASVSSTEDKDIASLEKHARPILKDLSLSDASKEAKVHEILLAHFRSLKAWHDKNDAQLKALWSQFGKARSDQDQAKADGLLSQIDAVYATFKPQHEEFITKLAAVLTPDQIEKIKDTLTIKKVKVTFDAYGQIFHGLTDEQKAFILKNLKAAREEAIDAGAMTEKSAFFKKYKIKIEAYLTAQGYDVKQSYKEFVAKQKAEMAAKKTAAKP